MADDVGPCDDDDATSEDCMDEDADGGGGERVDDSSGDGDDDTGVISDESLVLKTKKYNGRPVDAAMTNNDTTIIILHRPETICCPFDRDKYRLRFGFPTSEYVSILYHDAASLIFLN